MNRNKTPLYSIHAHQLMKPSNTRRFKAINSLSKRNNAFNEQYKRSDSYRRFFTDYFA